MIRRKDLVFLFIKIFGTTRKILDMHLYIFSGYVSRIFFFYVAGWFSVVSNNSGTGNARVYRRVGALVRAGVPAFLLAKPLRAYTLTHSKMGKRFYQQSVCIINHCSTRYKRR